MIEQKNKKQQIGQRLPDIEPKDNIQQQESQSQQDLLNEGNLQPLTHQKKKKKVRRRKVRKHSPEYYEQKKIQKINKLKQNKWDSHFMNDAIPDILGKNKNKRKRTLSKIDSKPVQRQNKDQSKTLEVEKKRGQNSQNKIRTGKSFNVRIVPQANPNGESNKIINKDVEGNQKQMKNPKTDKPSRPKKSELKIQDEQTLHYKSEYSQKINQIFNEMKFYNCHKEVLESFYPSISNKATRQILDKQLLKLKQKKSQIYKIMQSLQKRQNQLQNVKKAANQRQDVQQVPYQIIDNYRISTLSCIEEILKWKQKWQNTYYEVFKKEIIFDLIFKVENYLLTILKSGDQQLLKFKKKSIQNQQDKQKKDIAKKDPLEKTKSKVNSRDPFLISIYGLDKESKEIILKIRACELLLLEEQYNSIKK